jgi:hypothetical protein
MCAVSPRENLPGVTLRMRICIQALEADPHRQFLSCVAPRKRMFEANTQRLRIDWHAVRVRGTKTRVFASDSCYAARELLSGSAVEVVLRCNHGEPDVKSELDAGGD